MAAPAAASRLPWCSFFLLFIASLFFSSIALSQSAEDTATDETPLTEKQIDALRTETSTNEDPDAVRRAEREARGEAEQRETTNWKLDLYGSVRLHGINYFDPTDGSRSFEIGDGVSRLGVSGEWKYTPNWSLFGRVEGGFDVIDTFSEKSGDEDGAVFVSRLHNVGIESDALYLKYGKSWSTYYTVAGAADRFSIFGGRGAGVYNAGTDGGATGTGRADNAVQTLVYVDFIPWLSTKPFNVNLQYQRGEPIPHVKGEHYGNTWSTSAWLEGKNELGIGLAYHRAKVDDILSPALIEAGIDGDASTAALAIKTYGDRWLVSLVLSDQENIETTNEKKYINGKGGELFAQWGFYKKWWLVGGGNWLTPDNDDPDAGDYKVKFGILGLRYTLDSFNRMLYVEWKSDYGTQSNGQPLKNEITFGVRWDMDY
jgi:outer membrane protein N